MMTSAPFFRPGDRVVATTGRHSGGIGTIKAEPTSDGWFFVKFDAGGFGRYPADELIREP